MPVSAHLKVLQHQQIKRQPLSQVDSKRRPSEDTISDFRSGYQNSNPPKKAFQTLESKVQELSIRRTFVTKFLSGYSVNDVTSCFLSPVYGELLRLIDGRAWRIRSLNPFYPSDFELDPEQRICSNTNIGRNWEKGHRYAIHALGAIARSER